MDIHTPENVKPLLSPRQSRGITFFNLLSTFGAATATGLSAMVDGDVSHDQVTRFLSAQQYTSKDLWQQVKPTVRSIERDDGVLIFDDTIQEKAWSPLSQNSCRHQKLRMIRSKATPYETKNLLT